MAQVTIYLTDELRDQARAAKLNVSAIAQLAIRAELDRRRHANRPRHNPYEGPWENPTGRA